MRRCRFTARTLRQMWAGVLPTVFAILIAGAQPSAASAGQQTVVMGGDVVYSVGGPCTVGFNAEKGGDAYGIMPGHCSQAGTTWYADQARKIPIGTTAGASFPSADYGVIRYTNTAVSYPGEVRLGTGGTIDITGAASPRVGQPLCHLGWVTGYHCGTVRAVNVSVAFPGGTVFGLFTSSACAEPRDAGGPAFSGGTALGFIVAAQGCASGGTTYYQPIVPVLAAYGLTLR